MAEGWALSTGNLPRGGLPRNSVDRITDRPDMTSAVDLGCKALIQLNLTTNRAVQLHKIARGLKGLESRRDCTIYVVKTKALTSCTVTAQLICAFVFNVQKAGFLMT